MNWEAYIPVFLVTLTVLLPVFVAAHLHRCKDCKGKWKYRNPYDRTCVDCGRNEQEFCYDMKLFHKPGQSWWEPMNRIDE